MYRVLDESEHATVGIQVISGLTAEDWSGLIPYLQKRRKDVGLLNILFDLKMMEGENLPNGWVDILSHVEHVSGVTRIALVGDPSGVEVPPPGRESVSYAEVRYFSSQNTQGAWDWLKK